MWEMYWGGRTMWLKDSYVVKFTLPRPIKAYLAFQKRSYFVYLTVNIKQTLASMTRNCFIAAMNFTTVHLSNTQSDENNTESRVDNDNKADKIITNT